MQAMTEAEQTRVLSQRIEIDDVYLGGVASGAKVGRGAEKKIPFIAAVETDKQNHPLHVILEPVSGFTKDVMARWSQLHIAPGSRVYSDGLECFCAMQNCEHCRYVISKSDKSIADTVFKWVNTIISNVKTAFGGTFHSFKFNLYAPRYLGLMQFRFNHRFDLRACFWAMLRVTIKSGAKTKKSLQLTADG